MKKAVQGHCNEVNSDNEPEEQYLAEGSQQAITSTPHQQPLTASQENASRIQQQDRQASKASMGESMAGLISTERARYCRIVTENH